MLGEIAKGGYALRCALRCIAVLFLDNDLCVGSVLAYALNSILAA